MASPWIPFIPGVPWQEFRPARVESPASQKKMALSEEKHEEVRTRCGSHVDSLGFNMF